MGHHYNYDEGISYPQGYHRYGEEGHLLARPLSETKPNQLYSGGLLALDRRTKSNLHYLKSELIKSDPCYEYGMKHWHPGHKKDAWRDNGVTYTRAAWEDNSTLFSNTGKKAETVHRNKPADEEEKDEPENRFCYLCTTLEQHKLHLAKRGIRLKEKKKPKPRVVFIPPPPAQKKKPTETVEATDVLYKVTVKTAKRSDAGTSAKAFIKINGRKGSMKKKPLTNRRLGNFCFSSGSTENFHFKGPDVGEIKSITLMHDGLEKRHSWLVEEVDLTNLTTGEMWTFPFGQWLSLFHGDFSIQKVIRGERKEVVKRDFEIKVVTGKASFAGTSAHVFITLYGKKGTTGKLPLSNKDEKNFDKGKEDIFNVTVDDIGTLSSIKIEHDNVGQSPDWCVEKIVITDDGGRRFVFPCGDWLSEDQEGCQLYKYLYPMGRKTDTGADGGSGDSKDTTGTMLRYQVKVTTGGMSYAGTDARVFLTMHGKLGVVRDVELQNGTDCFEKNQTDKFRIEAQDVGDLKKITIRHDNSGLGPGWFLEEMSIQRFFSNTEVNERLCKIQGDVDEDVARRASEAGVELKKEDLSPKKLKHTKSKRHSDDEDDEKHKPRKDSDPKGKKSKKVNFRSGIKGETSDDSSEDEDKMKKRSRKMKKQESSDSSDSDPPPRREKTLRSSLRRQSSMIALDHSDEEEEVRGGYKGGRVPHFDEYLFTCHRWLAEDEDDGQLSRTLKPKSITTFYKMK